MMQKAMVNSFASEQIKPLLQKWYRAFASYMGPDGKIDEGEMQKLRESGGTYYDYETGRNEQFQSWNDLVQMGLTWRDSMMQAFGWSGGSEEYLHDEWQYECLQYNNLAEKRNRLDWFFSLTK